MAIRRVSLWKVGADPGPVKESRKKVADGKTGPGSQRAGGGFGQPRSRRR
jgi:hypothetical protein